MAVKNKGSVCAGHRECGEPLSDHAGMTEVRKSNLVPQFWQEIWERSIKRP